MYSSEKYFTRSLMQWHATHNRRSLPWKEEKDPYRIWLSEVILQQTRAEQGLPYYLRFTEAFPRITDMAAANDEEVFRLWQGLGYYNRCKNMLATARQVSGEKNGVFPGTYEEIADLKGIGPYTAAAIASFAYGLPHAVVDGNVYRVLSRYFGIETPIDSTEGKKTFTALAQQLLEPADSGGYNQAIMDLGATVCTPRKPACDDCPLQKRCVALQQELTDLLPVKSKKLTVRKRYFHYILLRNDDKLWINKRTGPGIWENLHQPYLVETDAPIGEKQLADLSFFKENKIAWDKIKFEGCYSQRLTHQLIETRFFSVNVPGTDLKDLPEGRWSSPKDLNKTAFPKTLVSFLKNNLYF